MFAQQFDSWLLKSVWWKKFSAFLTILMLFSIVTLPFFHGFNREDLPISPFLVLSFLSGRKYHVMDAITPAGRYSSDIMRLPSDVICQPVHFESQSFYWLQSIKIFRYLVSLHFYSQMSQAIHSHDERPVLVTLYVPLRKLCFQMHCFHKVICNIVLYFLQKCEIMYFYMFSIRVKYRKTFLLRKCPSQRITSKRGLHSE